MYLLIVIQMLSCLYHILGVLFLFLSYIKALLLHCQTYQRLHLQKPTKQERLITNEGTFESRRKTDKQLSFKMFS